ncbi:MAG: hypothetical protein AAGD38_21340, partial [Acidobacteriota bacterium]
MTRLLCLFFLVATVWLDSSARLVAEDRPVVEPATNVTEVAVGRLGPSSDLFDAIIAETQAVLGGATTIAVTESVTEASVVIAIDRSPSHELEVPTVIVDASGLGLAMPAHAAAIPVAAANVLSADFELMRRVLGTERSSVVVIVEPAWLAIDPELEPRLIDDTRARATDLRVVSLASIDEAPIEGVEAIYIPSGLTLDAKTISERWPDVPVISGRGRVDIDSGVLAAIERDGQRRLARRVALAVSDRLRGGPSSFSVPTVTGGQLVIDRNVADRLGIALPWALRLEAALVGTTPPADSMTLRDVMTRAIEANLDFSARQLRTAANEEDIARAMAARRPQLTVGLSGLMID